MDDLMRTVLLRLPFATSVIVPLGFLWHYWRRANAFVPRAASSPWARIVRRHVWFTRTASAVAFGAVAAMLLDLGAFGRDYDGWSSFLIPLTLAIVCIGALACLSAAEPRGLAGAAGHLDLTTRSLWSFGRRFAFASWILVAVLLLVTLLLAGLASSTDDDGRYSRLTITLGTMAAASTTFPGWYFGVPVFIGVALLTAVTGLALWAGARPSLAVDPAERTLDVWLRRLHTRTVLTLGGGALTLTLAWMLISIGGAGTMAYSAPAGNLGTITVGSPLAAVAVPLTVLGLILQGIGVALLLLPLLTKQPQLLLRDEATSPPEPPDATDGVRATALRS
ncbi:hypothetical protein [Glaciibacter psychrotolerans]|uniref:Uncharacterized protein n=1 Tax=Glaciibacter psychrotolerans TaxID=670054 RepID=A0A7Z0EF68_9MICO|nr:hypothetical protein [Leifsonia psychrotolerans]NYJ20125.1 hypothetical protein [Leifsonia psychrotolerans]